MFHFELELTKTNDHIYPFSYFNKRANLIDSLQNRFKSEISNEDKKKCQNFINSMAKLKPHIL